MSFGVSEFSNSEVTYVYHYGILRTSVDARLFNTDFGKIWIPRDKKITMSFDKKIVAVPTWFAQKKGIRQNNGRFK